MNFANPYLFDAILDGIPHRFVLVQECEFMPGHDGFSPPRFSVGAVNATRDPRYSAIRQLMEVGVSDSALQVPPSWLMAHQYIYVLHEFTDEFGWQYRSQWSALGPPGPKDEPWTASPNAASRVRRRIWLTTIVPKYELVRAKRLLAENLKIDYGNVKLQGELYRYEKGTLNRSWNKRRFILYHNRIEIYTSSTKKTEVLLQDCEVKMLPDGQIAGAKNVFVIRNLSGTVNVLLSAEDQATRREWVFAIQYQLAMNSPDVNFVPLEYSPPTGDYPDNRVLAAGDLKLQGVDGQGFDRTFQLLPREVVYFDGDDLRGRIFVEKATVAAEDRNLNFSVTSSSGITLNLAADTPEQKNMWMLSVRKQVQNIDAYNTMRRNLPREELDDPNQPAVDRISQFYDGNWSAPPVAGEDEEYIRRIFTAPYENHPDHFEFSDELGVRLDKKPKPEASTFKVDVQTRAHTTELIKPNLNRYKSMQIIAEDLADIKEISIPTPKTPSEIQNPQLKKINELILPDRKEIKIQEDKKDDTPSPASSASPAITPTLPQTTRSLARLKSTMSMLNMTGAVKFLNVKRVLINPRFMLASLKGITHRFVLVLESENRISAPRDVQDIAPLRFTVGGSRASKDPRMVRFDQLIGISNKNPEVQLPPGWFMLHQYVNIIQSNTDDYGWQYRSTWSEGSLNATDEQWVDVCDEAKLVRRRLWMTTVVKRDDFLRAKKMVADELVKAPDDFILKEDLYLHDPDKGSTATSWQRRNVILYHNKVEFYSGNEKVNDVSLLDCEVKLLSSADAGGRSFPFSISHPNGSINVRLDATDKEMRLRWMRALQYQLALITPEVNFAPFPFGPPTGELQETRILLCGDLEVLDNATNEWDLHQIQLQEKAVLVLNRDGHIHGRLLIDHAVVKAREDECEFTVKTQDGLVIHFRAMNADVKFTWVRFLKRQIHFAEYASMRKATDESTSRLTAKQYQDSDWIAREGEYGEDDAHMRALRQDYKTHLVSIWSGERGSETPTASSLVTEQWRITQQNAALKLNATAGGSTTSSSDITQIARYPMVNPHADTGTDNGSQNTEPLVKTITRVVRTTTTTTTTNTTNNVSVNDPQGTKTVTTGSAVSKDIVETTQKQIDGGNVETTVRSAHTENTTGAPIDVKNIPIPSNLLSKFGKTKSPSNSGRFTADPGDDTEMIPSSPLRNNSLKIATGGSSAPLSPKVQILDAAEKLPPRSPRNSVTPVVVSNAVASSTTSSQKNMDSTSSSVEDVSSAPTPSKISINSKSSAGASGGKTQSPDAPPKAPEFTTITLRGVLQSANNGENSAPTSNNNLTATAYLSPRNKDKSGKSLETATVDLDDLDTMLNVRKEDIDYHDDEDEEDGSKRRSPVHMHTTSQYFTEEEEDKGEDFEEAALAVQQLGDSNNVDAQRKLRTLNQMTMAYMRRLGYIPADEEAPTHASIPMNHLNDYDQAYVVENGFFRDGESEATHAYIPLEALRRSLMSLEAERHNDDIKKVTLRHVPTNLLIRRGIVDKPAEPESELLREARRRATIRRFDENDGSADTQNTNNDDEPEFSKEARRRQQSRRVSMPDSLAGDNVVNSASNNEVEPEFLREAKRRQASRRLSLENESGELYKASGAAYSSGGGAGVLDEEEEAKEAARRAERIAAMEAEVARRKAADEMAKKLADEETLRKIAEEKTRKLLEVGVIENNSSTSNNNYTNTTARSWSGDAADEAQGNNADVSYLSPGSSGWNNQRFLPPSASTPTSYRRSSLTGNNNNNVSLSSPNSFDLEEELSQVSRRLRPVAADDMSVGSYQRDDVSISSQKRRVMRLKNMSTEYLSRKGYLLPGNDFATIPLTNLRSSDQKLVTENGFLNEEGTHAIIPLKNTDTTNRSTTSDQVNDPSKMIEQVNLKPVSRDGLPPPRPGIAREDSSVLKSVQLRPVADRNQQKSTSRGQNDSAMLSPLVQIKQKLRRVSASGASSDGYSSETGGGGDNGQQQPWSLASSSRDDEDSVMSASSPSFKAVKLRSVKGNSFEDNTSDGLTSGFGNDNVMMGSGTGVAAMGSSFSDEGDNNSQRPSEQNEATGNDFDDLADDDDNNNNNNRAIHSVQDLRARNVRSNSIIGRIQKFEKAGNSSPTAAGGNNSNSSSEARGISKSTTIAAKRSSEVIVPPSPSMKPPAGRSNSLTSPTNHSASATNNSTSVAKESSATSSSAASTSSSSATGSASAAVPPRGTTASIAAAPGNKPPNPLLQRKKSMTDKGLGGPKKSFRF